MCAHGCHLRPAHGCVPSGDCRAIIHPEASVPGARLVRGSGPVHGGSFRGRVRPCCPLRCNVVLLCGKLAFSGPGVALGCREGSRCGLRIHVLSVLTGRWRDRYPDGMSPRTKLRDGRSWRQQYRRGGRAHVRRR